MNYMNWRVYTLKKMLVHLRKATSWKELWKVGTEQTQVSKFPGGPLEQQLSELAASNLQCRSTTCGVSVAHGASVSWRSNRFYRQDPDFLQ